MRLLRTFFFLVILISSCVPKEQVVLRSIKNMVVDMRVDGIPVLTGEAVFYNPNNLRMKLTEINIAVFVEGKKSAQADQQLNSIIPAKAEFSVPLEIQLSFKEIGLLDTVLSLFGGKKYEILCQGYIRLRVHGVSVKVPVSYKDEIRLKI